MSWLKVKQGFVVVIAISNSCPALATDNRSLAYVARSNRLHNARELLGKYYSRSPAKVGENIKQIDSMIYRWTKDELKGRDKKQYVNVAQAIINEARNQGFDPIFLMSVIKGESGFGIHKIGGVGEIGLMQIRPTTGKWIAQNFHIPWKGNQTLHDPVMNIRIGAAYLGYLRDKFDHATLYLAAYNMGQRRVANVQERNIWPKDYPIHVMKRYLQFYSALKARDQAKRAVTSKRPSTADADES